MTPQVVTGTSRTASGFTFSAGVYTYTGGSGNFMIGHGSSFSFTENTTEVYADVYLNGSIVVGSGFERTISSASTFGSAVSGLIVNLSNGDTLEIRYYPGAHTGDDDITIDQFHFTAIKL